jgi:ABC-type sugar transport system permease subunit
MLNHAKSAEICWKIPDTCGDITRTAGTIVLGILIFPMLSALVLSFTDLVLTKPESGVFIGLEITGCSENLFILGGFGRTMYFAVITVVFEVSLGLANRIAFTAAIYRPRFCQGLNHFYPGAPVCC